MKKNGNGQKEHKGKYQKPKVVFCKKLTAVAGVCASGYTGFSFCKASCGGCARS